MFHGLVPGYSSCLDDSWSSSISLELWRQASPMYLFLSSNFPFPASYSVHEAFWNIPLFPVQFLFVLYPSIYRSFSIIACLVSTCVLVPFLSILLCSLFCSLLLVHIVLFCSLFCSFVSSFIIFVTRRFPRYSIWIVLIFIPMKEWKMWFWVWSWSSQSQAGSSLLIINSYYLTTRCLWSKYSILGRFGLQSASSCSWIVFEISRYSRQFIFGWIGSWWIITLFNPDLC